MFSIAAEAAAYPFRYPDARRADLGALATGQPSEPGRRLATWVRGFGGGRAG